MMQKTVKIGLVIAIIGLTIIMATFIFLAKRPLDKEEVVELARRYIEEQYEDYSIPTEVEVRKIELYFAELLPTENATELFGRWGPSPGYLPANLPDKMWLVEFDVELTIKYLRIGRTADETRRTHAIVDGYTGDHLVYIDHILTQEWLD